MKILLIGSGGREHALAWKISQSKYVEKIIAIPGNAGISKLAECIDADPKDFRNIANIAERQNVDITIVGHEEPLANGIVDYFSKRGLRIFGPTQEAAKIEASKAFAKQFMRKNHIPTATFMLFDKYEEAVRFVEKHPFPLVIKADGLAGGKGVVIAENFEQAKDTIAHMMIERAWGDAGRRIIVEDFLTGTEVSVLSITDGYNVVPFLPAQDYKRAFDNDEGPNTGGMGAIAPHPLVDERLLRQILEEILQPAVDGLRFSGTPFRGILYAGIMLTEYGPKVLEFNCRFGDPETQVILPLLKSDLVEIILFAMENRILEADVEWSSQKAVSVVMASSGYPKRYKKGYPIEGLAELEAKPMKDVLIFHAGTTKKGNAYLTDGGRVLNIVGIGETYDSASSKAYGAIERISFEKAFWRSDIAGQYR